MPMSYLWPTSWITWPNGGASRTGSDPANGSCRGCVDECVGKHTLIPGLGFRKQLAYERHWVGVAVRVLLRFPSLQFALQPNAIGVVEVEGLTIAALDNVGDLDPMVLEALVGLIELLRRGHDERQMVQAVGDSLRGWFGPVEDRESGASADLDVVMPPPVWGKCGPC